MRKVIERIRQRPEHHRDRIIWICVAAAAAVLLIIWMIVGNGRKATTDENFFKNFSRGVDEGKNIVPQDLNINSNTQQ